GRVRRVGGLPPLGGRGSRPRVTVRGAGGGRPSETQNQQTVARRSDARYSRLSIRRHWSRVRDHHRGGKMTTVQLLAAFVLVLASGSAFGADTKVELKGTHLCCGQCVKAVGDVLGK